MLEDIISYYRKMCTRTGQFDILLNIWVLLIVIFGVGGLAGLIIFIKLDSIHEIIRLYLSLLAIFAVEIIYLFYSQIYIFYKQKKYVIKELTTLMENGNNKQVKNNILMKLNNISESNFKFQYIGRTYYIDTLYNKLKFNEFLKISKIDSKNVETVKENIKEHIKDKSNFKDIIDIAFWGLMGM